MSRKTTPIDLRVRIKLWSDCYLLKATDPMKRVTDHVKEVFSIGAREPGPLNMANVEFDPVLPRWYVGVNKNSNFEFFHLSTVEATAACIRSRLAAKLVAPGVERCGSWDGGCEFLLRCQGSRLEFVHADDFLAMVESGDVTDALADQNKSY